MKIKHIKSMWPEKENFFLEREDIGEEYIFLHFLTPAELYLEQRWIRVEPGGCILYDRHSHQKFRTKENRLLHNWFHAEGDCDMVVKKYGLQFGTVYYPAGSEEITRLIQSIELEQLQQRPFFQEFCALKAEELFAYIARGRRSAVDSPQIAEDTRRRFIALRCHIHQTFEENWNTQRMASQVNLSPSRFYALYRQIFGISPKQDLQAVRIEHAKRLLLQNKYSVEQVAELSGYQNPYHFIRQFKQFTGMTPGNYSKLKRICTR